MKDELTGIDRDKLVSYEVVGNWPTYKMTLREVLKALGAVAKNGFVGFKTDDPILDMYPRRLEPDCMGYGINEQWVVGADTDKKSYLNLFTETELLKQELDDYFEEQKQYAKEIKEHYDSRQLSTDSK